MEATTQTSAAVAAENESRGHHPYSPSSLQSREACACFKNRNTTSEAATTGTLQHAVVETGVDNHALEDDKALAAAECLDFMQRQLDLMEEARNRAEQELIKQAVAAGAAAYLPPAPVLSLAEIYLPVDDCKIKDVRFIKEGPKAGQIEVYEMESTTAGYVDRALISHDRKHAVLLDWKFGMWAVEEAKNNLQGIAYTLGLFRKYPTLESIRFFFKMPHLDYMTEATFTRDQIPDLYLRVQTVVRRAIEANSRVVEKDDFSMATPRVPACNFCDRLGICPKVAEVALSVGKKYYPLEIPSDITPTGLKSDSDVGIGMRLSQVMASWAKSFRQMVTERTLASAATGEVKIPEGFFVQSVTPRELKDVKKFKEVTLEFLTQEELESAADYTFGKVEKLINLKSPRGAKKAELERYSQALRDAGAVVDGTPYSFLKGKSTKGE